MKYSLLSLFFIFSLTVSLAQKANGKKVKTKVLSIPCYDISSTDPSTILTNFAIGNSSYGTERMKDMKSMCMPKNGSIKDVMELKTYFYEVDVDRSFSYLTVESNSMDILYAREISPKERSKAYFGKDKCEHWIAETMKTRFKESRSSWENTDHNAYASLQQKEAERIAKINLMLTYLETEFDVYTAKGKPHDYSNLDRAQELALNAYRSISENGINNIALKDLEMAIEVWTPLVQEVNWENKDSKYNKNVGQGLLMNLTNAHRFRFEMEKALDHALQADKSFGSFTNNRRLALKEIINHINLQKGSVKANRSLIEDINKLNEMANAAAGKQVTVNRMDAESIDKMRAKYLTFGGEKASELKAEQLSDKDAGIDNTNNPYNAYVMEISGGKSLTFMKMQKKVESFPVEITQLPVTNVFIAGNDMKSMPPEIGNMTELKNLNVSGNDISEIPSEIGRCQNLEKLNLNGNPISSLPESIGNLSNLRSLSIKNTKIDAAGLKKIQGLLPNCKIKS